MLGDVPYRGFPFEYPPLALLPMVVPRIGWGASISFPWYVRLFVVENTLWLGLLAYCVVRIGRRCLPDAEARMALWTFMALALLATPILPWRFDLFPSLLTALAVVAALDDRPGTAGVWIGLGAATKLYPIVLMPAFVAWFAAQRKWGSAGRLGAAAIATVCAIMVPVLALAGTDVLSFVRYHQARGLEIESVAAGLAMLAHLLRGLPLTVVNEFGAMHVRASGTPAIERWLFVSFLFGICALSAIAYRRFRAAATPGGAGARLLVHFSLLSLLVMVLTNKVFSPQYLAWLLPFAALLPGPGRLLAMAVFGLTIIIFPYHFDGLTGLVPASILLLNVRNALAVALAAWLLFSSKRYEPSSIPSDGSRGDGTVSHRAHRIFGRAAV